MQLSPMPTLGQFNKVVCDSLSLWSNQDKELTFDVPATEKERRAALKIAFAEIQVSEGSYGTLSDLKMATSRISPQQRKEAKKSRTVQAYVNYLAKEDFSSIDEFIELREYIRTVIDDRFADIELAEFAKSYYSISIDYYKEFIREVVVNPMQQAETYSYFIKHVLMQAISVLLNKQVGDAHQQLFNLCKGKWPLRGFVDVASRLCNVSLHKLNQFHEIRLNSKLSDKDIWDMDFTALPINTKSKQVIDRLGKNNKIKWDTFHSTIKPLACRLPSEIDEKSLSLCALGSFITHNLNIHTRGTNYTYLDEVAFSYPVLNTAIYTPVTDRIDSLINESAEPDGEDFQSSIRHYKSYHYSLKESYVYLNGNLEVPDTINFIYNPDLKHFSVEEWSSNIEVRPEWIDDWIEARHALRNGCSAEALKHFKLALKGAKYLAGPLFFPFYFQVCAFCKSQYKEFKKRNEENLFDRFYEPLGSEVSSYAILIGVAPRSIRDPKTLIPKSSLLTKNSFLINKIDLMVENFEH